MRRLPALFALAAVATLGAAQAQDPLVVRIEAAAAAQPLLLAAVKVYEVGNARAARIATGVSGDDAVLRKLCRKEVDIAISSRPIYAAEIADCARAGTPFVELPLALDALAVVVNARNRFVAALSIGDLRRIWSADAEGRLNRWRQIDASYPDVPLKLIGPERVTAQRNLLDEAVLGPKDDPRRDVMSSADERLLARAVARDPHTLSYVSYAVFAANRSTLRAVPISARTGQAAVAPSPEAVGRGEYAALARPLIAYVSPAALARPAVRAFVDATLANGAALARQSGYAPLGTETYRQALAHAVAGRTGTGWGGVPALGVTPELVRQRLSAF